ncbi:hypothetical protein [uncultured Dubosiella sp.]|uniref:hypothetical protein n=1 Tax=uncultured Dubosiella sp. TaxID=1937011 RepID=UPI0025B604CF|nr:hypothetical protein [uncultured Dubosiella sp.]
MAKRRPSMHEMLEKKEKRPGKVDDLEKDDFRALNKAAFQVFVPVILGAVLILALVILIFTLIF